MNNPNDPDKFQVGQHALRPAPTDDLNVFADTLAGGPEIRALQAELKEAKFMLAMAFGGPRLYGDDGELYDNSTMPHIDFKRDSISTIHIKLKERQAAALASKSKSP